jgi:hypothetical protein
MKICLSLLCDVSCIDPQSVWEPDGNLSLELSLFPIRLFRLRQQCE